MTSDRTPCLRHPRETWIAGCPDCTTWHLTGLHVPHHGDAPQQPDPRPAATPTRAA